MSEFGEHWERKLRTFFQRFDIDGDGLLTRNDFERLADRVIKTGHFTGYRADELRNLYLEIWDKYFKPEDGGNAGTFEEFLANVKSHGKSELGLSYLEQNSIMFDAVDTSNDGVIELQEFINYFNALGIGEEIAKEAFKGLDTNHDGVLSREEFISSGINFFMLEEPSFPADAFYGSLI